MINTRLNNQQVVRDNVENCRLIIHTAGRTWDGSGVEIGIADNTRRVSRNGIIDEVKVGRRCS